MGMRIVTAIVWGKLLLLDDLRLSSTAGNRHVLRRGRRRGCAYIPHLCTANPFLI